MQITGLRALVPLGMPLLLIACYSPNIPNGKQQCGPNRSCAEGYFCGPDDHCYKNGTLPAGDLAIPRDMTAPCTADSCKGTPKPVCDPDSHACVDCLQDLDCPPGRLCSM